MHSLPQRTMELAILAGTVLSLPLPVSQGSSAFSYSACGCVADGSVRCGAEPVAATVRCAWGAEGAGGGELVDGSCPALRLLREIEEDAVTKNQLELVVAHSDEDLAWSSPYSKIRTTYHKSRSGTPSPRGAAADAITLPNVGKEQHTYVWHIFKHYDSLAERTVFMHGRSPSCGFFLRSHDEARGKAPGHLMSNVSAHDYLDAASGPTFMPLTMRFDTAFSMMSIRAGFADLADPQRQRVPLPVQHEPAGEGAADVWLPWERNFFGEWVRQQVHTNRGPGASVMTFDAFFRRVFGQPPPPIIMVAQGAQFAASAAALRRLPRQTYEWLLTQMTEGHDEVIYYLEMSWNYILNGLPQPPSGTQGGSERLPDPASLLPMLSHFAGSAPPTRRQLDRPESSHKPPWDDYGRPPWDDYGRPPWDDYGRPPWDGYGRPPIDDIIDRPPKMTVNEKMTGRRSLSDRSQQKATRVVDEDHATAVPGADIAIQGVALIEEALHRHQARGPQEDDTAPSGAFSFWERVRSLLL